MQTVGITTGGGAGPANYKRDRKRVPLRDEQKREAVRTRRHSYDFLTQIIAPICRASVTRAGYDGEVYELITEKNYTSLRESYFRYADLLGVRPAPHDPGKTYSEGIVNLYFEMRALLSDKQRLNFDYDLGGLHFTIWQHNKWGKHELYWFPVSFVTQLNPQLRRIAITFIHELMKSNGLDTIIRTADLEMTTSWIEDCIHEFNKEDRERWRKALDSYDSGPAQRLLTRVEKQSYYKKLPRAIARYEPRNDYEARLKELMREGLQFIGSEKPAIASFGYDPYREQEPDFHPIGIERQIRFFYEFDEILNSVYDTLNNEQHETYTLTPVTTLRLSRDTESVFAMNDYPERFFVWADKFIRHIS